jgi:hypothetical protein
MEVLIVNDNSSNAVYVNPKGSIPLNLTSTTGYTTAGSNVLDLNTPIAALGLQVGDLVVLNEGDANDGVYSIIGLISGTNKVKLDKNLIITHNANQNFKIQSAKLEAGESIRYNIGTQSIGLVASGASTEVRIYITYQKN